MSTAVNEGMQSYLSNLEQNVSRNPKSKLTRNYMKNASAVKAKLPSKIGSSEQRINPDEASLPSYMSPNNTNALYQGEKVDPIRMPETADRPEVNTTGSIMEMGQAATERSNAEVAFQQQQAAEARQNRIANSVGAISWDSNNGGAVMAPVLGANGSASWINQNNGRYHDYDNAFGAQCVDLYAFYTSGFAGGQAIPVQGAKDIWNSYDSGAYVRVAGNQRPQMGDVAIWGSGYGGGFGHVGIVAQGNGGGTIRVLNANATSAGSRGVTTMTNLSTAGLLGYLRPRKLIGG